MGKSQRGGPMPTETLIGGKSPQWLQHSVAPTALRVAEGGRPGAEGIPRQVST